MKPTETALIVPLPEAEEAVGPFRSSLDRAAARGVPAHVTVLAPFLPPERIDHQVLATVSQAIRAIPRFDVALTHVEWFGAEVVWLAPRPDRPFRDLTNAVWQRFPDYPPYAGAYPDPTPHLTIGHDAEKRLLDHAAEVVSAHLPIRATVEAVRLICGSEEPDSWHTLAEFPLGHHTATG